MMVNCRKADIIAGPVRGVIADSMWGEITPQMALAVGQSLARHVLVPVNICDNIVAGVSEQPMSKYVESAVWEVQRLAAN